jgi:SAM-dependent methyltransferase
MRLLRSPLVRPLDEDWRGTLTDIARARSWPTVDEPARLGKLVARLSAAYNMGETAELRSKSSLAARLGFSFARDVPKSAGAVRELVATGTLAAPEGRALTILDLGSGLGASTWGIVLALAESGAKFGARAMCVDHDEEALTIARAIAEARRGRGAVSLAIETRRGSLRSGGSVARELRGPFDVVVLGQVLSEIDGTEEARLAEHLDVVHAASELLAKDGSLVIIEPALRERTRSLHALRDAILAASATPKLTVFAPCLHQSSCPALRDAGAWCHEDLDVDLPAWLVPVASAAGLRWQGLTFSYLVLRRDGKTLRDREATGAPSLVRVVSEAIVTKGKREAFVCGDLGAGGALAAGRARVMRLDRDASDANATWDEVARGDVVVCAPPLDRARPRIGKETSVVRVDNRTRHQ